MDKVCLKINSNNNKSFLISNIDKQYSDIESDINELPNFGNSFKNTSNKPIL